MNVRLDSITCRGLYKFGRMKNIVYMCNMLLRLECTDIHVLGLSQWVTMLILFKLWFAIFIPSISSVNLC